MFLNKPATLLQKLVLEDEIRQFLHSGVIIRWIGKNNIIAGRTFFNKSENVRPVNPDTFHLKFFSGLFEKGHAGRVNIYGHNVLTSSGSKLKRDDPGAGKEIQNPYRGKIADIGKDIEQAFSGHVSRRADR